MKELAITLLITAATQVCFCQQPGNATSGKKIDMKKTQDTRTAKGHLLISAEIVEMVRTDKKGEIIAGTDLYVRRSAQDFFIKFSESVVTKEAIKKATDSIKHHTKSLNMEVEIRNGLWDSCDNKELPQSRTGAYMVIHRLIAR